MKGIIQKDGTVIGEDGKTYQLPVRGTDSEGFPEVLIDAKSIGGRGSFQRQSVKPLIGKQAEFVVSGTGHGYNYIIIEGPRNFTHVEVTVKPKT